MKLNRAGVTIPIYFVMTRSLQGFDESSLDNEDLLFGFDIKGQVQGRKALDNPREILTFPSLHRGKR